MRCRIGLYEWVSAFTIVHDAVQRGDSLKTVFASCAGVFKREGSVDFHAEAEAAFDKGSRFMLCESQTRCVTTCCMLGPVQLPAVAESVLSCAPSVPGPAVTCVSVSAALPTAAAVNVLTCLYDGHAALSRMVAFWTLNFVGVGPDR